MQTDRFFVRPVPPFRLDLTVWALRRRAHNVLDRWDGETYRRALVVACGRVLDVAVVQIESPEMPRLKVTVAGAPLDPETKKLVGSTLDRLLGTSIDLQPFYALAEKDRRLAPLAERFRGVKPPRFPSVFEGLVNGIACQQISLNVAITLLNRLVECCGKQSVSARAFPGPEELAGQDANELRSLGFSRQKARALLELAKSVSEGRIDLESIAALNDDAAVRRLLQLRGVGRWTAEYLLLRGLGRLEMFPGDDVGARQHMARWLKRSRPLDYEGVRRAVQRWQPYAGLVYFHLLLDGLAEKGILVRESYEPSLSSGQQGPAVPHEKKRPDSRIERRAH